MPTTNYSSIEKAGAFTQQKLETLRKRFGAVLADSDYNDQLTIVATGSFGRGEAFPESDLDLFILLDADIPLEEAVPDELREIERVVVEEVPSTAGDTGTFGPDVTVRFADMLRNIGGHEDSNHSLTRRMLFLLEGTWLHGEKRFAGQRELLLKKYLRADAPAERVPWFLLNDIIRYYRTIATDFEHKVTQDGKPWGLRNIKLRFSRKLLYFGGIIVAAELVGLDHDARISKAAELFAIPVLQRMAAVGDSGKAAEILEIYDRFLCRITDVECRQALESVTREQRHDSPIYKELREMADQFSLALAYWLEQRYPHTHPIHHALLF